MRQMLASKRRWLMVGFTVPLLGLLCSLGCRSAEPRPWPDQVGTRCVTTVHPNTERQSLSEMRRYRRQAVEDEMAAKLSEARDLYSAIGGP